GALQSVNFARAVSKIEASALPSNKMTIARTMQMARGNCAVTDDRFRASFQLPAAILFPSAPLRMPSSARGAFGADFRAPVPCQARRRRAHRRQSKPANLSHFGAPDRDYSEALRRP